MDKSKSDSETLVSDLRWVDTDGSSSGYIEPIKNCPHIGSVKIPTSINTKAPCTDCNSTKENWHCLECFGTYCGRFIKSHGVEHFKKTKHSIAVSFSDLSFWCYACDSYVRDPKFSQIFKLAHQDKFQIEQGNPKPGFQSYTGHKGEDEIKEYVEEKEVTISKIKTLAKMIKEGKHLVIYTGAGVSTSAKIPDYRGPTGVWSLRDKGLSPNFEITIEQALPTETHMAIKELVKRGICKFVCSTNVDGLHRRSGISENEMSELHGNCYKEYCGKCNKEYLRNFDVTCSIPDHKTGRKCTVEKCGGELLDTIIHFEENLPEKELEKTVSHAEKSDVALVLGTSMRVAPANSFPYYAVKNNGGNMIIVNLQKTPYDSKATLRIFEKTDFVMKTLMDELGILIPEYKMENDVIKNVK